MISMGKLYRELKVVNTKIPLRHPNSPKASGSSPKQILFQNFKDKRNGGSVTNSRGIASAHEAAVSGVGQDGAAGQRLVLSLHEHLEPTLQAESFSLVHCVCPLQTRAWAILVLSQGWLKDEDQSARGESWELISEFLGYGFQQL